LHRLLVLVIFQKGHNTPTCCILDNCQTKRALLFGLTYFVLCWWIVSKVTPAFTFRCSRMCSALWFGTGLTDYGLLKRSDVLYKRFMCERDTRNIRKRNLPSSFAKSRFSLMALAFSMLSRPSIPSPARISFSRLICCEGPSKF
jgi:hypothetical protein